jgi:molybdopterin converting factor small subunit
MPDPEIVATETEVPVSEPTATEQAPNPAITREEFAKASPFLRNYQAKQQAAQKQEPVKDEKAVETQPAEVKADTPAEGEPEKPAEEPAPALIKMPDGREFTLDQVVEWEKGHLRQSDYTKKTQSLAEERRKMDSEKAQLMTYKEQADKALQLARDIELDPIGTLDRLRDSYAEKGIYEAKDPEVLAQEKRIRSLEQEKQRLEHEKAEKANQDAVSELTGKLEKLAERYKDKFDQVEVLQFMVDNKFADPEAAFKAMKADVLVEDVKKESESKVSELQKQIDELKAQMKTTSTTAVNEYVKAKTTKSEAPLPVGATGGGGSPPVQINRPRTFQEARKAAMARGTGG